MLIIFGCIFISIPILVHNRHCVCFLYESIVKPLVIHKYAYIFYFLNKRSCPKKFYFISWAQNYAFTLGASRENSGLITRVLQTLSLKTTDLSKLPGSEKFGQTAVVRVQIGTQRCSSLPHPQESDLLLMQYPNCKHVFYIKEKHLRKNRLHIYANQF